MSEILFVRIKSSRVEPSHNKTKQWCIIPEGNNHKNEQMKKNIAFSVFW